MADGLVEQQPPTQLAVGLAYAAESLQHRIAQPADPTHPTAQEPMDAESRQHGERTYEWRRCSATPES